MQFYADVPQHHADSTDSSAACSATFHASEEFAWILLDAANPQQHPQYQAGTVPSTSVLRILCCCYFSDIFL